MKPDADNEVPAPELLAEARVFAETIEAMSDLPKSDKEMLRFTVTVPREFAIMAAWVMFKEDLQKDGDPVVLPRPVQLHFDDGRQTHDWQRAKSYFQRAIFESFDRDFTGLLLEKHPLLYPRPPAREQNAALSENMDDDIPF